MESWAEQRGHTPLRAERMKVNKRKQLYPGLWGRKSNEAHRGRRRRLGWGVAHIQAGAPPSPVVVGQVGVCYK